MNNKKFKNGIWILSLLTIGLFIASCTTIQNPRKSTDTSPVSASCAMSYPKVGFFNEVMPSKSGDSTFTQLSIEKGRTFDANGIIKDNRVSIDKYQELAQKYAENYNKFPSVPIDDWTPNQVKAFKEAFNRMNVQKGDIIVNGPPMEFCSFGFLGIFTNEGSIKYAEIRDSFNSYSYKGETIDVEPGKLEDCIIYTCDVQADFKVNDESFILSIGETYNPDSEVIKSITLSYASIAKEGAPILSVDTSKQIIYVIEFN